MKKFNEEVRVSIDADQIGQYLLSLTNQSVNAEAFVEAVVGYGINKGSLGNIFISALSGKSPAAEFVVGDECICDSQMYVYNPDTETSEYQVIGSCRIIKVNPYADAPYQVEFYRMTKSSGMQRDTDWVNQSRLTVVGKTENLDII